MRIRVDEHKGNCAYLHDRNTVLNTVLILVLSTVLVLVLVLSTVLVLRPLSINLALAFNWPGPWASDKALKFSISKPLGRAGRKKFFGGIAPRSRHGGDKSTLVLVLGFSYPLRGCSSSSYNWE